MNVLSGKVVGGVIQVEGLDLAEGAVVTVLSPGIGEDVVLSASEQQELAASIAEANTGRTHSWTTVKDELMAIKDG